MYFFRKQTRIRYFLPFPLRISLRFWPLLRLFSLKYRFSPRPIGLGALCKSRGACWAVPFPATTLLTRRAPRLLIGGPDSTSGWCPRRASGVRGEGSAAGGGASVRPRGMGRYGAKGPGAVRGECVAQPAELQPVPAGLRLAVRGSAGLPCSRDVSPKAGRGR